MKQSRISIMMSSTKKSRNDERFNAVCDEYSEMKMICHRRNRDDVTVIVPHAKNKTSVVMPPKQRKSKNTAEKSNEEYRILLNM